MTYIYNSANIKAAEKDAMDTGPKPKQICIVAVSPELFQ